MLGETVVVLVRAETGRDAMGEPAWEWEAREVENVLVRALRASDAADRGDSASGLRPDAERASYTLAMPRGSIDPALLRHARVALVARGMAADDADAALRLLGEPDVTPQSPTAWDMLVDVGRADG